MNILYKYLSYAVMALVLNSCLSSKKIAEIKQQEEEREREILQDSTSIYSLHPSKPFKYGYAYTLEECEDDRRELEEYNIKNGEVVASIGAASGWKEGVYSTMLDSVTFYIQDVDTSFLNQDQLEKVIKYYSNLQNRPQTNQFQMVIGSRKYTNLPYFNFDKIIIHNAFHHIQKSSNMYFFIKDLKHQLLSKGQVIIGERMSNEYKKIKNEGCEMTADKATNIIKIFSKNGLYLTNMILPENSFDNKLFFELDKYNSDKFYAKKFAVDKQIKVLDKMNLKRKYSDSLKSMKIVIKLKPKIDKVQEVYSSIDFYLNNLGLELINKEKNLEAINVMKANVYLFPESSDAYRGLGTAYLNNKEYQLAKISFEIAQKLNPKNTYIKSIIKDIEEEEKNSKTN